MSNPGGSGGGIVRINAFSQLTFATGAIVSVNGDPATAMGSIGAGGGGAGTIEIIADRIMGSATLQAMGGATAGSGGAGAGGLVMLRSANLTRLPSSITVLTTLGNNTSLESCVGNDGQNQVEAAPPASRTRFLCRGGTFDEGRAAAACTQCPPGQSGETPGSTACTDCGPGSFAKNAGSVACTPVMGIEIRVTV